MLRYSQDTYRTNTTYTHNYLILKMPTYTTKTHWLAILFSSNLWLNDSKKWTAKKICTSWKVVSQYCLISVENWSENQNFFECALLKNAI